MFTVISIKLHYPARQAIAQMMKREVVDYYYIKNVILDIILKPVNW